jgi:hypothetical protein
MIPIVVKNSKVPSFFSWFFPISAITLFPFIFVAKEEPEDWLIMHETIHIKQYMELLIVGFLALYLWDFLRGLYKHRKVSEAYHSIRFEQEAYHNEGNPNYLKERKWFAWRKYEI